MTHDDEAGEPPVVFAPIAGDGEFGCCPSCLTNIMVALDEHEIGVKFGTALAVLANVLHQQVPVHERVGTVSALPGALLKILGKMDVTQAFDGPPAGRA